MTVTDDDLLRDLLWNVDQVAEYLGVKRETVMTYHKRWMMPRADARGKRGNKWFWFPQTIIDWQKTRPGSGNRAY